MRGQRPSRSLQEVPTGAGSAGRHVRFWNRDPAPLRGVRGKEEPVKKEGASDSAGGAGRWPHARPGTAGFEYCAGEGGGGVSPHAPPQSTLRQKGSRAPLAASAFVWPHQRTCIARPPARPRAQSARISRVCVTDPVRPRRTRAAAATARSRAGSGSSPRLLHHIAVPSCAPPPHAPRRQKR